MKSKCGNGIKPRCWKGPNQGCWVGLAQGYENQSMDVGSYQTKIPAKHKMRMPTRAKAKTTPADQVQEHPRTFNAPIMQLEGAQIDGTW